MSSEKTKIKEWQAKLLAVVRKKYNNQPEDMKKDVEGKVQLLVERSKRNGKLWKLMEGWADMLEVHSTHFECFKFEDFILFVNLAVDISDHSE